MEFYFYAVFGIQVMVLVALEFGKSGKDRIVTSPVFNAFKNNYLVVYSLMMGMTRSSLVHAGSMISFLSRFSACGFSVGFFEGVLAFSTCILF